MNNSGKNGRDNNLDPIIPLGTPKKVISLLIISSRDDKIHQIVQLTLIT